MTAKGAATLSRRRAVLTATAGPNAGDSVTVELGTCRLIGRHLSESETALMDRDGNRVIDDHAADILERHLKDKAPPRATRPARFSSATFERGADIVFADDSISRAHAMVFYDAGGFGIIDLASTNGTFINSERVTSTLVGDGDVMAIGNSKLTVRLR